MKRLAFTLSLLVGLLVCLSSFATIPGTVSYQGLYTDAGGPVNGSPAFVFRLFNNSSGGTEVWTETKNLTVTNGIFNTQLGDVTALPDTLFKNGQTYWLQVEVGSMVLTPRVEFNHYAGKAAYADTAMVALSGTSGNELWSTDGTNVWRLNGSASIGTNTPGATLHLERGQGAGDASVLLRSYLPGTGTLGKIQFQNILATDQGIAAEVEAIRPTATWGQESDLLFKTNPGSASPSLTERMRITSNGRVGIDTPVPLEKLHVAGGNILLDNDGSLMIRNVGNTGSIPVLMFDANDNTVVTAGNTLYFSLINGGGVKMTVDHSGLVTVFGDLCVTGQKNAIVPTSIGMTKVYSEESAEVWFADYGEGQLQGGRATIELDPLFLETVTIDDGNPIKVFVTANDECNGVYVKRGAASFEVIELGSGTSNASFSYRVVAKRQNMEHCRFEQLQ